MGQRQDESPDEEIFDDLLSPDTCSSAGNSTIPKSSRSGGLGAGDRFAVGVP
jgi:hypothetical protein